MAVLVRTTFGHVNALRYTVTVTVTDFVPGTVASGRPWVRSGLTLERARRLCERAARRGLRLYGGELVADNWGARGGSLRGAYRSAVIRCEW